MTWENYGDVNYLENDGMFIKKDDEVQGRRYYAVEVVKYDEIKEVDIWAIRDMYVDLDDTWIDWNAVESYADKAGSDERKVQDVVSYYGPAECGCWYDITFSTEDEVMEYLRGKGCID